MIKQVERAFVYVIPGH